MVESERRRPRGREGRVREKRQKPCVLMRAMNLLISILLCILPFKKNCSVKQGATISSQPEKTHLNFKVVGKVEQPEALICFWMRRLRNGPNKAPLGYGMKNE